MKTILPLLLFATACLGDLATDPVLYPYGPSEGDRVTPKKDDGYIGPISISDTFIFFGKKHNALYVNNNGVISFGVAVSKYTPDAFPLADGSPFVAPYWGDVNNEITGTVYFRESKDPKLLDRISKDMKIYYPNLDYKAKWSFVATWDKVAYFGSRSRKTNTFQAVLTTDGKRSFIILNYGPITWTTGKASGGDPLTGLGGIPAQAGFNSGDKTNYFNIPGSRTPDIVNIKKTSNVNNPGRWVFEVDKFRAAGGCVFEANFVRYNESFWKDPTCETKCTCNMEGDVDCEEEWCSSNLLCEPANWHYSCKIGFRQCF
ncbi:alpha-tectorin-like [Xenopus tropicalis]|uniref:Alpha-tectorin-like n=1 Tax=Xenopus tropicalis TaxID=8364 RepID=A0A803JW58_XENTR|nr:alpha-tectorin-like [Xenopus tropicalis]